MILLHHGVKGMHWGVRKDDYREKTGKPKQKKAPKVDKRKALKIALCLATGRDFYDVIANQNDQQIAQQAHEDSVRMHNQAHENAVRQQEQINQQVLQQELQTQELNRQQIEQINQMQIMNQMMWMM